MDLGVWEEQGDRDQAITSRRLGGMGQVNDREPDHVIICEARVLLDRFHCLVSYLCVDEWLSS